MRIFDSDVVKVLPNFKFLKENQLTVFLKNLVSFLMETGNIIGAYETPRWCNICIYPLKTIDVRPPENTG